MDEYFASNEFISGVEAGAEFGLMNSSSTNSVTTPTIPLSHQLNTTSPFADSGVDLVSHMSAYQSVDNEDDVFIVEKNGRSVFLKYISVNYHVI